MIPISILDVNLETNYKKISHKSPNCNVNDLLLTFQVSI